MKLKSTIFALATLAAGGLATAADLGAIKGPAPVMATSWTGLYIGASAGARWVNTTGQVLSAIDTGVNILLPQCVGACPSTSWNSSGFRLGAFAGYNWQVAPSWVVGVEGDIALDTNKISRAGFIYPSAPGTFYGTGRVDDFFGVRSNWDAGLRLRAGFLITPGMLLYATGGLAVTNIESTSTCGVLSFCVAAGFQPFTHKTSTTLAGWTIGAGLEAMISANWTLRAEYRYAQFASTTRAETRRCCGGGAAFVQTATYSLKPQTHTLQLGVAYKF